MRSPCVVGKRSKRASSGAATAADELTTTNAASRTERIMDESLVRQYVGRGLNNLMERLVPNANTDDAVSRYREHHQIVMRTETKLMPGVAETIPELARRGLRLAVCSNKRVEFTRELVNVL